MSENSRVPDAIMRVFEAAKKTFRAERWQPKIRFWKQPQRQWLVRDDGGIWP